MDRGRFAQWLLAALVVACGLGACVSETAPTEETSQSASAVTSPAGIPCSARANAVIANTGNVFSNSGSLVDSYKSSVGRYGGTNIDSSGDVQAAEAIVHNGGVIDGTQTQDVAAGLAVVSVPSGATNLPLGSKTPGSLDITTAAESITLAPGNYVVANLTVQSPGAIAISPAGAVQIWVTGNLNLGGNENLSGVPENFAVLVTSSGSVNVNGSGELFGFVYAPTSMVSLESTVFGGLVGATVNLNAGSSVHFDQSSVCPIADAGSDAAHDAAVDVSVDAPDASHDGSVDVAVETGVDSGHDASADAPIDASDASRDVGVDAAADSSSSGGHDASADASIDVSADVASDASADSSGSGGGGQDAAADASVDVTVDVGVDAPTCTAASCDTNNPCVLDTCNPDGTCSHAPLSGTTCSTGDLCFASGVCEAGACVGTTPIACTASDQCHVPGTCDPTTGACSNPTEPDGTTCNDGNACTQIDACVAGVCTGSNSVVCTAIDACHAVGTCDPISGMCSNPAIACSDAGTPMLAGPTLNGTVASNLASMAAPLYTTSDGGTGAINVAHVAVIRGHVFALPGGNAFAGVTVSVLGHPEYATAATASDGSFNLAVNGGGQLTVVYTAPSGTPTYLPVQRHTASQWQQWATLPDVYMTYPSGEGSLADLGGAVASVSLAPGRAMV